MSRFKNTYHWFPFLECSWRIVGKGAQCWRHVAIRPHVRRRHALQHDARTTGGSGDQNDGFGIEMGQTSMGVRGKKSKADHHSRDVAEVWTIRSSFHGESLLYLFWLPLPLYRFHRFCLIEPTWILAWSPFYIGHHLKHRLVSCTKKWMYQRGLCRQKWISFFPTKVPLCKIFIKDVCIW